MDTPLQVATKLVETLHDRPVTLVKVLVEQLDAAGERTAAVQRLVDAGLLTKNHPIAEEHLDG